MSEQSNVEVVQGVFAAFGRADIPAVLSLLAEDVVWTFPGPAAIPFAGERHGHAGATEFFMTLGGAVEFDQFEVRELVAQGDKVVALGFERGRVRASGRSFDNHWALVFTVRDGLVTNFRSYEDTAALVEVFAV